MIRQQFPSIPDPPAPIRLPGPFAMAALFLVVAFALRWTQFGDPIIGLDEQFYLLTGDRMWHGALPYVDIWDRKPLGLFLIYAAIRLLPGDGILAYQIVSTLFLAATGTVIAAIARRELPPGPAMMAGITVIAYAGWLGAGFGEAPIFYDLLTASALWCVLRAGDARLARRATLYAGAAMLLCGLALTIKTTALFESIALGLALLATHAKTSMSWQGVAWRAWGYALLGIAPTLAMALFYVAHGAFTAFWFANVVSVTLRTGGTSTDSLMRLLATFLLLSPLIVLAVLGGRGRASRDRPILLLWLAANVIGLCAVGFFYFHYALPMVAPLAILAAPALRARWLSRSSLVLAAIGIAVAAMGSVAGARRDQRAVTAILRALPDDVPTHCLLVYEGPAILYHLSHACLVTPYAFPGHFASAVEADALGRPHATILRAALARRPAAIVASTATDDAILAAALARDYRPGAPIPLRLYGAQRVSIVVWRRKAAAQ